MVRLQIGGTTVSKQILIGLTIAATALFGTSCTKTEVGNSNANANAAVATTTRPGPDNSEIATTVDANGVKTETRTFKNNPRVSKVVVTTRNGQRTVKAYSPSGEEKEVNDVGDALEVTGDKIAAGAGWVADKGEDVGHKAAEGTKSAAKEVGDKAEDVADKTVSGAKKVGSEAKKAGVKTAEETKKAVKKIVP
jgi:hypothetical protein